MLCLVFSVLCLALPGFAWSAWSAWSAWFLLSVFWDTIFGTILAQGNRKIAGTQKQPVKMAHRAVSSLCGEE